MHNILELNHHNTKFPFSIVMLHPAPQIKLWGGEDLEVIRENHLIQNTSHKLTKKIIFKKNIYLPYKYTTFTHT